MSERATRAGPRSDRDAPAAPDGGPGAPPGPRVAPSAGPAPSARPAPRKGRRPGSPDTRGRILGAARASFSERGYDGATVRGIAARAAVDPALVHHYFGTKQQLFVAAMEPPVDVAAALGRVFAGPPEGVGERFMRTVLDLWETPRMQALLVGLIRSAATDPSAADMLRALLTDGPLVALARAARRPDAELRASLVGSQLVGLAMARYIVRIEPLASATREVVARAMGPTIERYLLGDLAPAPPIRAGSG